MKSLQEQYAPNSLCYGCGPENKQGFQIKSYPEQECVIARWTPDPHHHAFPNILNGGVIGTLLDCHCNWAAAYFLMKAQNLPSTPCTVTAEYTIKLLRPTPMGTELVLEATLDQIKKDRAVIRGRLFAEGKLCDTCVGTFVAVKKGHPAFSRW